MKALPCWYLVWIWSLWKMGAQIQGENDWRTFSHGLPSIINMKFRDLIIHLWPKFVYHGLLTLDLAVIFMKGFKKKFFIECDALCVYIISTSASTAFGLCSYFSFHLVGDNTHPSRLVNSTCPIFFMIYSIFFFKYIDLFTVSWFL